MLNITKKKESIKSYLTQVLIFYTNTDFDPPRSKYTKGNRNTDTMFNKINSIVKVIVHLKK